MAQALEERPKDPMSDENRSVNDHSTNNHNKIKKPSGFFVRKFENKFKKNNKKK